MVKINRSLVTCAIAIAIAYGGMFALGITCPIRFLTGISCPGCGMTRALLSALRMDFQAAFYYHPLWVLLVPWGLTAWWLIRKKKKSVFNLFLSVSVAVMLGVYLYRLAIGSEIVAFSPDEGAIAKLIKFVNSLF